MDTIEFLRNLGTAIAAHRRAAGLTQEKLAERLGTSPEWLSQMERGVGRPSIETLLKVAEGLDTSPAALVEAACGPVKGATEEATELMILARRLGPGGVRVLLATARAIEDELQPSPGRDAATS